MQIFVGIDNKTFTYNGLKYVRNFIIIKHGSTNLAIHNVYDTEYQLLASTHFSEVSVDGVVYGSQSALLDVLAPFLIYNSTTENDTLATVTQRGNTTVTPIIANSFVKSGGTASQFLKADGTVDSNTYALDSNVLHKNGTETKNGGLNVLSGITSNTLTIGTSLVNEDSVKVFNMDMATGVYEFSGITMGTGQTFNVAPVKAYSIDNTNITNPVPLFINYSGATNVSTPYLVTAPATYITLTSGGTLNLMNTEPTEAQYRSLVLLGVIGHPAGTLTGIGNRPDVIFDTADQFRDMFRPIRLINDGVFASSNGTNLTFKTSAGKLYGLGIGFVQNGKNNPTTLSINATTPTTFQYRTSTGTTFSNTTTISAGTIDVNGVATVLAGGGNTSTNQRIYLLENGNFRIQFGQTSYTSLVNAIAGAQSESFNVFSNNKLLGVLVGILSVRKGATDLSDSGDARFLPVSKFGETVGAAGGITTATLQTAYNNSTEPEILTNTTLGALTLRRGSAADTNAVIQVQNGAGAVTSHITGAGVFTGTSFVMGSTSPTNKFTIVNDSSTGSIFDTTAASNAMVFRVTGGTKYNINCNPAGSSVTHTAFNNANINFATNSSTNMIISGTSGNVIINNSVDNGVDKLQVNGNAIMNNARVSVGDFNNISGIDSRIGFNTTDNFNNGFGIVGHYGMSKFNDTGLPIIGHSGYYGQRWYSGGAERMRLTDSGRFLIGTTSSIASAPFQIQTTSFDVAGIYVKDNSSSTTMFSAALDNNSIGYLCNNGSSSQGNAFRVDNITGSKVVPYHYQLNGVTKFQVNTGGTVTAEQFVKNGGTIHQALMADGSTPDVARYIWKENASGAYLLTTGTQIVYAIPIPANTLKTEDQLNIVLKSHKIGATNQYNWKLYVNTGITLTGAVLLYDAGTVAAATVFQKVTRSLTIYGGNIYQTCGSTLLTDIGVSSSAAISRAFNVAQTNYLVVIASNIGAATDSFRFLEATVTN